MILVSSDKSCIFETDMENVISVCNLIPQPGVENLDASFQSFHFVDNFAPKS